MNGRDERYQNFIETGQINTARKYEMRTFHADGSETGFGGLTLEKLAEWEKLAKQRGLKYVVLDEAVGEVISCPNT